ncbi:MAG: phenylalanine--tRNA ligase subunit beta [Anaerolineales bacterium]
MKVPLTWLQDFLPLDLPVADLARRLTLAGLEVEEVRFVGKAPPPEPARGRAIETKVSGLAWDPEKIVVGEILEVMPHPQADRLVLARVQDGTGEHVIVTGAPNLFPFRGSGPLPRAIKIAYAREGSRLYDGHRPGWELMTLKPAVIRGVPSASMACSEKELGISEDHEGVILLDDDAPVGRPLAEYMGDVVFDISLTPNLARDANILGVAREISALIGEPLRPIELKVEWTGKPIAGRIKVEIENPDLNPRFVLGLIEGVRVGPSPYWVQRRLRLAGMRPINNVVDATNYVMLEVGQPLHAFDYQALVRRAGGVTPTLVTRLPKRGETLATLDGVARKLDDFTVLVADSVGALSMAGVMGGAETEVTDATTDILLEGAAWSFLNIRRTLAAHKLPSEAAYRFSRGVHPALAETGVRRGLMWMQRWAGGTIAEGIVDEYPEPRVDPTIEFTLSDVERWLGIRLPAQEIASALRRLEFGVEIQGDTLRASTPPHRLDIGEGAVGRADLMEEIARITGYDRIPETLIADVLPPQRGNRHHEREEHVRDRLVALGLQEVVTYRLTSPERETALLPEGVDHSPFLRLANPIANDRTVLRRRLLAGMLEVAASNSRREPHLALFEVGPVFHPRPESDRPDELARLGLVLVGRRALPGWQPGDAGRMGFFDLKGAVDALFDDLHLPPPRWEPGSDPTYHPGKCAHLFMDDAPLGMVGEVHPLVLETFGIVEGPVAAAELDLRVILDHMPDAPPARPVPSYPPVLEDVAVVVDEKVPAGEVERVIRQAGGKLLAEVRLFDVYRGEPIPAGKKSLAFSLVAQAPDRTLTDAEAARLRSNVVQALETGLAAKLRE